MEFYHEPVMASECIEALNIKKNGIYVDGTTGGGGHSLLISKLLTKGRLICFDRDEEALNHSKEMLKGYNNITYVNDNFKNMAQLLKSLDICTIDGVLLDLGVSSRQLDDAGRGFSYMKDAPLDMRMDLKSPKNAREIINYYEQDKLAKIFFEYGEEKFSRRIASRIVERRQEKPIETTLELAEIIEKAIPASKRQKGSHPAKRVFQAVRIEVNGELDGLYEFIMQIPEFLNPKGRIAAITFHSLEDRIVKRAFYDLSYPCKCPPDMPKCVCGKESIGKPVYRKPVVPAENEIERNPRSKSAKLRAFEKLCKD